MFLVNKFHSSGTPEDTSCHSEAFLWNHQVYNDAFKGSTKGCLEYYFTAMAVIYQRRLQVP